MTIKSAIITGAGSGIGRALAKTLADENIQCLAIGRTQEKLEQTAEYAPMHIHPLQADITLEEDINRITDTVQDWPKNISLFHAAGIFQIGHLMELDEEDWYQSFEINVSAKLHLTKALQPYLKNGRVLFIGSDATKTARIGAGAYSIAQAASQMLVEVLKKELKEYEISVGSFKPGLVATEMVENFTKANKEAFPDVEFYKDWIAKGQIAPPETIATFAKYLLLETDRASFTSQDWDIRETSHHEKWLKGKLYPTQ